LVSHNVPKSKNNDAIMFGESKSCILTNIDLYSLTEIEIETEGV